MESLRFSSLHHLPTCQGMHYIALQHALPFRCIHNCSRPIMARVQDEGWLDSLVPVCIRPETSSFDGFQSRFPGVLRRLNRKPPLCAAAQRVARTQWPVAPPARRQHKPNLNTISRSTYCTLSQLGLPSNAPLGCWPFRGSTHAARATQHIARTIPVSATSSASDPFRFARAPAHARE
jgi:hypothetical protein